MTERLTHALTSAERTFEDALLHLRAARGLVLRHSRPELANIRDLIEHRRLRDSFFPAELFGEPGWDLLLDLAAARLEGTAISITSACIAAAVPNTTALRWLKLLESHGLIERVPDGHDGRRINVRLTDTGWSAMVAYLSRIGVSTDE